MADILILGISHYPPLHGSDERMPAILKRMLQNPKLPAELKTPAGWPAPMQAEWGNDEGTSSAAYTPGRYSLMEDMVHAFDVMCADGYAQDGQVTRFTPRHDKWRDPAAAGSRSRSAGR